MQRSGKIARLQPALRTELNQSLAVNPDGATLRLSTGARPGARPGFG